MKIKASTYSMLYNLESVFQSKYPELFKIREHLVFIFVPQKVAFCRAHRGCLGTAGFEGE